MSACVLRTSLCAQVPAHLWPLSVLTCVLMYMQVCSLPNLGAIVKSTCVSLFISKVCTGLFCLSGYGCVSENAHICVSLCFQLCGACI